MNLRKLRRPYRTSVALIAGMAAVSVLAACSSSTSSESTSSAASEAAATAAQSEASSAEATGDAAAPSGEPVKVGVIRPTTGLLASSYAPLYLNLDLAVEEVNAAGGILGRPVELVEVDDGADPANEAEAVRKLQEQGVGVVMGPTGSNLANAAAPATTQAKILSAMWDDSQELNTGTTYPYQYLVYNGASGEGVVAANYLCKSLGLKKIGILEVRTVAGKETSEAFQQTVNECGAELTTVIQYAQDAQSFVPFMQQMKDSGAEGFYINLDNLPNALAAVQALQQLEWYPPIVSHNILFKAFTENIPQWPTEFVDNFYVANLANYSYPADGEPKPAVNDYVTKLRQIEGFDEGGLPSAPFYDFLYLYKEAAESVGNFDPDAIKGYLDQISGYEGMNGDVTFTAENRIGIPVNGQNIVTLASANDERSNGGFFFEAAPGQ